MSIDSNGPRLEMWEPSRITPYDKNPRSLPQKAVDKVAGSLKAFGFQKPIVVDEQGVIIAGHVVYKAALKAGFVRVPVLISNLDAKSARAYRLADNRTSQETDWLDDLLRDELTALPVSGGEKGHTRQRWPHLRADRRGPLRQDRRTRQLGRQLRRSNSRAARKT